MATEEQLQRFGRALREAREEEGLSQTEVAERLSEAVKKVSSAAVGHWERGANEPGRRFVQALEVLLHRRGKLAPLLGYTIRHPTAKMIAQHPDAAVTLEGLAESLDSFARELKVLSATVRRIARGGR